tara:strand:- start:22 stop:561 length:540 start_codon:yes stop_codon:yes gene_type:complete
METYTKRFLEPDRTNIFKSLQNLNSDFIVKIIDYKVLPDQEDSRTLHQEIIMEKIDCFERNYSFRNVPEHENDLYVYLYERSPRERYNMMMKVYEKYLKLAPKLYDLGIYHTDLRFHNFMVDKNDEPKIIDLPHFDYVTPFEFMAWHNGFLSFFQQTFCDNLTDNKFYEAALCINKSNL